MAISTAFLLWAADLGYLEGRHHEVLCRLNERQEDLWILEDTERRADPKVQAALHSIATVKKLQVRQSQLKQRIAEAAAPFESRIAEAMARMGKVPLTLSEEAMHRIQDSKDDVVGAQADFNKLWDEARRHIEPYGSFWQRSCGSTIQSERPCTGRTTVC
jgi:hypothetical protein